MLRSLCEYLERRSTWVIEYQENGYLVPDDETWDDIQALVAETEEMLMGCDEFTSLMADLLAAMQCVCSNTGLEYGSPLTPIIYQEYFDQDTLTGDDLYPGYTSEVDAERCAIAVLTYEMCYEILTEIVQPAQNATQDFLLPAVLALIIVAAGSPALLLPGGAVYLMVNALIDAWVEGQLANVVNELVSNKQELVCAVYEALDGGDFRAAEAAAWEVIDDMTGISVIDKLVFKACFAPWCFRATQVAYGASTDWAVARLDPGLCETCGTTPAIYSFTWEFPPCPQDWMGDFDCWNGHLCMNATEQPAYTPNWLILEADDLELCAEIWYTSNRGSGKNVVAVRLQRSPDGMSDWVNWMNWGPVTYADAGETNYHIREQAATTLPAGYWRLYLSFPQTYNEYAPYPFMLQKIRVWTQEA